jgi:beta-phosphoglucomutase
MLLNDYEAIIFDFDGVFLDSEPLHYEACYTIFNDIGINISYEEFTEKYLGLADREMFPLIFRHNNYHVNSDEINSFIKQKVINYIDIIENKDDLPLIRGLEKYIAYLAEQNKKIAICSGPARNEIMSVLKNLKDNYLTNHFNTIIASEDVTQGKPSPEGYLLTARKLNVSPDKCLVIEDSPHGIMAAKNAGMNVIALLTTQSKDNLKEADYIAQDFNQLMA